MRIGVISDTHGGLESWHTVFKGSFSDADLVIHAGDIFYHGIKNPQPKGYDTVALVEAINEYPRPLIFCKGNCDSEVDQLVVDIPIQSPYLICHFDGLNILVHHGHLLNEEEVLRLATRWDYGICISGHTHIPRLEQKENVLFLNPGSPALPKGEGIPTVGMIETSDGERKDTHISILDFQREKVLHCTTMG
jgi:putative phosphoesterase